LRSNAAALTTRSFAELATSTATTNPPAELISTRIGLLPPVETPRPTSVTNPNPFKSSIAADTVEGLIPSSRAIARRDIGSCCRIWLKMAERLECFTA